MKWTDEEKHKENPMEIRKTLCLGMNLAEVGMPAFKGQRKKQKKKQIVCIRTVICTITSISKPSVAFNLKELKVLCRQHTDNNSNLQ